MTEGKKFDQGKLRFDLLGPQATEQTVAVLTHGAEKYGDTNWSKVEPFEDRYFSAVMRHLWAWRRGEEIDPDSGLPHLAHAAAGVHILLAKALGDDAHLPSDDEVVEYTADILDPTCEPYRMKTRPETTPAADPLYPCAVFSIDHRDGDLCLRGSSPNLSGAWTMTYLCRAVGNVCRFEQHTLDLRGFTTAHLEVVDEDLAVCGFDSSGRGFLVARGEVYYAGEVQPSRPVQETDTLYRVCADENK